jgi:hypothetical protein
MLRELDVTKSSLYGPESTVHDLPMVISLSQKLGSVGRMRARGPGALCPLEESGISGRARSKIEGGLIVAPLKEINVPTYQELECLSEAPRSNHNLLMRLDHFGSTAVILRYTLPVQ